MLWAEDYMLCYIFARLTQHTKIKRRYQINKKASTYPNINLIENLLSKKYVEEWKRIFKSRKFVETIKNYWKSQSRIKVKNQCMKIIKHNCVNEIFLWLITIGFIHNQNLLHLVCLIKPDLTIKQVILKDGYYKLKLSQHIAWINISWNVTNISWLILILLWKYWLA